MWSVWDKITPINGRSAADFLAKYRHLQNEKTIFIKEVNGRATQVEGKNILAAVYGIDNTLSNEEFIAAYEAILNAPIEDAAEETV